MYFSVKDYGAVGDGSAKDTLAIQSAIVACSAAGGGEVYFPKGKYISGTLELLDGVSLYLDKGAVLKASSDLKDFDHLPLPDCDVGQRIGFIYAIGKKEIGFLGAGTIDFSSEAFFDERERMPFPGMTDPLTPEQEAEATLAIKPRLTQPVCIHDCARVTLKDVCLCNSPSWTVHMNNCSDVVVDNVTINNSLLVPNCDGIGFSNSTRVTVSNCRISSADDCFTFCGTKQATVTNCILRSRSTAIRIGYLENVTEDIVISNIVIYDSNRGVIFQASKNGQIRNVLLQNIIMHTGLYLGAWWGSGEPVTIVAKGNVRNVMISDVRAESSHGIALCGAENGNVSDIVLRNWHLTIRKDSKRPEKEFIDFRDEPIRSLPKQRMPWIYAEHICNLTLDHVVVDSEEEKLDISPMILESQYIIS